MNIFQLLEFEEGFSEYPYVDTEGYPTIGFGTKIGTKNAPIDQYVFKVSREVGKLLIKDHLDQVENYLSTKILSHVNSPRYIILESMCYQLGEKGLDGFKKMWKAIEKGDWEEAAKQALDSKAARQTPQRWKRQAKVLRTGKWEGIYN